MPKKTLVIVLLILILTGGINATGLYIRKQLHQPEKGKEDGTPEHHVEPQETVSEITPAEIDTSDWKIYRNEKYGFEVKYPSTWSYSNIGDVGVGFFPPGAEKDVEYSGDITIFIRKTQKT